MTKERGRIISCGIFGLLILIGTIIPARTEFTGASSPSLNRSQAHDEEDALIEGLSCIKSFLEFQLPAAEKSCGETITLLPDNPLGYELRGFTYLLERRFERAEMDLREAVRLAPADPDNQAGYAQSLSGQGRFTEAIERFGIALRLSPRDVRYLSARCWARAGEGRNLDAALQDCNRALKLAPNNAVAFDSRALVHLRAGRNGLAARDYTSSLQWQSGRATALFGRGIAEFRLGQLAQAGKDLALARKADPEIDDIYILVGILEAGCHDNGGPCGLPDAFRLRPKSTSKYLSVSYRTH